MKSSFLKRYVEIYDLFNKSKDYEAECKYLNDLITNFATDPKKMLDLGCGSGLHANLFCNTYKYEIFGIDSSPSMIEMARRNHKKDCFCSFEISNIQGFKKNYDFDICVSLFHVLNYQINTNLLDNFFKSAYNNLKNGGILIFDYWDMASVIKNGPEKRFKDVKFNKNRITRQSTPTILNDEKSQFLIKFEFCEYDENNILIEKFKEDHYLKAYYTYEIREVASRYFDELANFDWMTQSAPTDDNWYNVMVLKKII